MNPLNRKGIILAGGNGTRLFPCTKVISKQLLPVYDKPLIYYPLSTLMLSGIKDILIICKKIDENSFKNLFGDGSKLGLNIEYKVQNRPDGIAQAYHLGESFLKGSPSVLILGDNIFHGRNFDNTLKEANLNPKSTIFSYKVSNPESYGVVESNDNNKILSLEEKPVNPKSNEALVGLYFLDETATDLSQSLQPSKRGELEITDLIQKFIDKGTVNLEKLDSGFAWYDAGTSQSLLEASQYFLGLEKRQSLKSACIEETAFNEKLITKSELVELIKEMPSGDYKYYLEKIYVS